MFEGLWTVHFNSNLQLFGSGVLILGHDKSLLGGDDGYYYTGRYEITDSKIKGELDVVRYEPGHISVFGNLRSGGRYPEDRENCCIPSLRYSLRHADRTYPYSGSSGQSLLDAESEMALSTAQGSPLQIRTAEQVA